MKKTQEEVVDMYRELLDESGKEDKVEDLKSIGLENLDEKIEISEELSN